VLIGAESYGSHRYLPARAMAEDLDRLAVDEHWASYATGLRHPGETTTAFQHRARAELSSLLSRYPAVTSTRARGPARAMSMTRTASPALAGRRCCRLPACRMGRATATDVSATGGLPRLMAGVTPMRGNAPAGDAQSQTGASPPGAQPDPSGAEGSQTDGAVGNTGGVADPGHDVDRTCAG
jgi:hypothetical protein